MNYFIVELSPISNKYIVLPNHTLLKLGYTEGSYAVLGARLFGLSYAQYLRMCRDVYHAALVGKNCKYISVLFSNEDDAKRLASELSSRAKFLIRAQKN